MGIFRTRRTDYGMCIIDAESFNTLKKETFERFTHDLLGLGDVARDAEPIDAVCAVFDLAGFTQFSAQVDPHLALPEFMNSFLEWLFIAIRQSALRATRVEDVALFMPLPFYAKFMGDGVMFLWDTKRMKVSDINNVPPTLRDVCVRYAQELLPVVGRRVIEPSELSARWCGTWSSLVRW